MPRSIHVDFNGTTLLYSRLDQLFNEALDDIIWKGHITRKISSVLWGYDPEDRPKPNEIYGHSIFEPLLPFMQEYDKLNKGSK